MTLADRFHNGYSGALTPEKFQGTRLGSMEAIKIWRYLPVRANATLPVSCKENGPKPSSILFALPTHPSRDEHISDQPCLPAILRPPDVDQSLLV